MDETTEVSSESESTGTESSSAPVSTSSIAAGVIADMEGGGDGSGDSKSEPRETTPAVVADKAAVDEDDFDSVPETVEGEFGRKKPNSIPHKRVKAMIAKSEQKVIAQVAKALGITKAEAEVKLDDVLGHVTETSTKYKDVDMRLQNVTNVEEIMANEPDRFIRMLAEANKDGYGKFLKVFEAAQEAPTQPAAQATLSAANDPEPEPDYPLKDGAGNVIGYTHSVESQKKHNEWRDRAYDRKFQAALEARFKPIEEARKKEVEAEQKRQRGLELKKQAEAKIDKKLEGMAKWPQFKENEAAILDALTKDPTRAPEDVYMEVILPKIQADRNTMREELLAEINGKPRKTSAATSTAAAKADGGKEKSTADFARESLKEAGLL
jgi:hypothetical protein